MSSKKKSTKAKKTTFVSFLLDETGSMQSIKDDTVGGFNTYLETLKQDNSDILFSLVSFNSSVTQKRYVAEPIRNVAALTNADYHPSAMTPLIDAAVKLIKATDEAVQRHKEPPNVVIVMQTDGLENVSVEYTTVDLAMLIKEKEAAGWQFLFLGAGLDAFSAARQAGIDIAPERVVSYDRKRSHEVFAATAANVRDFAQAGDMADLAFSPEQRAEVGDKYTDQYLDPKAEANEPKKKKARFGKKARKHATKSSTVDDIEL